MGQGKMGHGKMGHGKMEPSLALSVTGKETKLRIPPTIYNVADISEQLGPAL